MVIISTISLSYSPSLSRDGCGFRLPAQFRQIIKLSCPSIPFPSFDAPSAYRDFVKSPFAPSLGSPSTVFRFRLSPLRGKESSLFVPSFLGFFAASLRHFADTRRLRFMCASVFSFFYFFESFKHFLLVSFSLCLYYSINFPFVKGFLKNFFNFFEKGAKKSRNPFIFKGLRD